MMEYLKTLLLLSASGSVLGLLLLAARRVAGKRLPSSLWYYAWLPVLLRLVLPLPGLIPQAQTAAEAAAAPRTVQSESAQPRSYSYDREAGSAYLAPGGMEAPEEAEVVAAAPAGTVSEPEPASSAQPQIELMLSPCLEMLKDPRLWLGVWLAGSVLCFAHYTVGYVRFRRALMRTLQTTDGATARVYAGMDTARGPRLFCSPYVQTPMLLGLARPLIILPQTRFSPESARNVLRHELTHYRRGDLYVKWFFVLSASLHWFNPLMPLFRRELDRVCELSCDENVLARMESSERRSYGETLLDLAANRTLPAGVVATTFATEKHALKERLEQIMKFNYKPRAIIALTVAALLLMGLAALAAAPARASSASEDGLLPTPEPAAEASGSDELTAVSVSTVDELLAAIRPGNCIVLAPGVYDLSTASDYGQESSSMYYRWVDVSDGYELVITDVDRLAITASAAEPTETVVSAVPRYADVLAISGCRNITLSGFTAGHTVEQGQCAGGVIHLMGTDNVTIDNCALYGCGILGVEAENCQNIRAVGTDIYECSNGAVELTSCLNVQFDNCDFRDCYSRYNNTSPAYRIITVEGCWGVAITDGHVFSNKAGELVHVSYSNEVYLLGTLFEDNTVYGDDLMFGFASILNVTGEPIVIAGCEFRDDAAFDSNGESTAAVDMEGNALSYDALTAMKLASVAFPGFAEMETPAIERTLNADGLYEVHVSTVDEFLAAIAPDTIIFLEEGLYDLSKAANYGSYGGQYYYWAARYDGPELLISGVDNLSIVGAGKDETCIEALPRYAAVIRFDNCRNISVSGVTAGHTRGAGSCCGSVLEFRFCEGVGAEDCGLFGCGVYGVEAIGCTDIAVKGNEIYQCSGGAVSLQRCMDAVFEENDIHDCAYPTYRFSESLSITIDGEAVAEEELTSMEPEIAEYFIFEAGETDEPVLQAMVESGRFIVSAAVDIPGAGPYAPAEG